MFVRKLDETDAKLFKHIRLEALSLHADVYGGSFEDEVKLTDEEWAADLQNGRHAFFGLFDGSDIVGCSAVYTDRGNSSGKTALLCASYIRKEYRGLGLSRLLYEARIDWAKAQSRFACIAVGHREGNEASRRANQAFGFTAMGAEQKRFGDGTMATIYKYEMRI